MNIKTWYKKRGSSFILERFIRLSERYGFSPHKSINRIDRCVKAFSRYGCYPTFVVPGMVVERNLPFILRLQDAGAEIAVHGYNHVDLKTYPPEEASRQLQHAAETFRMCGLEAHGFRCPYLSITDDLYKNLPYDLFEYSSNKAIQWTVPDTASESESSLLFETIKGFYAPRNAESSFCLPWFQDGLVEIPVCVPDDLQLHDGLGYDMEQVSRVWLDILYQTYQRGEVFNLMFHPEMASFCEAPLLKVIKEAHSLCPNVWVARLREISAWWMEKSKFWVETLCMEDHFNLKFHCTPRATILYRGFDSMDHSSQWDAKYKRLEAGQIQLISPTLPFIGLPPGTAQWITTTLTGMGYILDTGETAQQCPLFLDTACLEKFEHPVDLVAYIENTSDPLVRFWPWPGGSRSALCITGDLDALSLFDYAVRLLRR